MTRPCSERFPPTCCARRSGLQLYKDLLAQVEGKIVWLEEYARQMVYAEETHASEVDKMLRRPGDVKTFSG